MFETHLRQAATTLLESAIRIAPPDTREWGQAMRGELGHVEGPWASLMWAVGGASVLAKGALASLLIPGRRGHGLVPDGGLFAKSVSVRKAALIAAVACVLGALVFLAAPPFRQGIRVSLAAWRWVYSAPEPSSQPRLAALAMQAEAQDDAEALAFCAVRTRDSRQSARLAKEAVRLDPSLLWAYAVVAVHHPELPEIREWQPKLEQWDPQNAVFHLLAAQLVDMAHSREYSYFSGPINERDPAWQSAMAAAFASSKFDDYLDRLKELDRRVVSRYRFNDPYELLAGEEADLLTYAFFDCHRYAQWLLESGRKLEARDARRGAADKYWAVARFGQFLDSQGHTGYERWSGAMLQAQAYKQLQMLAEKEGKANEAEFFGYLAARMHPATGGNDWMAGRWVFGQQVSSRNAAFLQLSGLMMLVFSASLLVAGSTLIAGSLRGEASAGSRAKPVATAVVLASGVGLLVSSATLYLTYRPYWYIFQRAILNGDWSQTRDLRDFLIAAQAPPGMGHHPYLPVYFWMVVALLGLIGLAVILLRHFRGQPQTGSLQRSS
jgi:hypothetical protein